MISARCWQRQGNLREAIDQFEAAVKIEPEISVYHYNLANALMNDGQLDRAAEHFRTSLQLLPSDGNAHFNFGNALFRQGKTRDAVDQWREAVQCDPLQINNLFGLAKLLATSPDAATRNGQQALAMALVTNELSGGGDPQAVAALAAAYAETGEFDRAAVVARQAVRLAQAQKRCRHDRWRLPRSNRTLRGGKALPRTAAEIAGSGKQPPLGPSARPC